MATDKLVVNAPDLTEMEPPLYANTFHVSFTPYDFRVTFSLLSPFMDGLPAEAVGVGEVVLPAAAVESFLDILRAELNEFVERYGRPQPALQQSVG